MTATPRHNWTDDEIEMLQRHNEIVGDAKYQVREMLAAPVVESGYSEEAEQYEDEEFLLEDKEVWTLLVDQVADLARQAKHRQEYIKEVRGY